MNLSELGGRFVGHGLGGEKIGDEARGVRIQELLDTLGLRGLKNESGVVIFRNAIDDFRVVVCGSVRTLLAGQGKDYAGIIAAWCGGVGKMPPLPGLPTRPFTPSIYFGGR